MVREGYSREQIEHRVHWALDTDVWERYVHITAEEHNDDIFAAVGIGDAEDGPDRERVPCGNCRQPVAPHHEYCPTCGTAATPERRSMVDTAEELAIDDLADGDLPPPVR